MIETMRALSVWLRAQDIDLTKVDVVLSAPFPTSERLGFAVARIADDLHFGNSSEVLKPIMEGQIYGIKFRIESN